MPVANRLGSRVIEQKAVYVFVSAYRGFALVVATFQIFFVGDFQLLTTTTWVLFSIVGAYTLYKVTRPLHPYGRNTFTYADFAFDVALCASLVLNTGGLHSPFLFYSLCPILTSALFFPRKVTFPVAIMPALSLGVSPLLYPNSPSLGLYPLGLSVGLLAAIVIISFLIAWLPYMININASQTIRRQAILSERSRLSREIHDGVAQSLGIVHLKAELLRQTIASGKISQALSQVTEVNGLIEEAQQEVRVALDELRVSADSKRGFVSTLARYTTEFTQTCGIRCELRVNDGKVILPLPAEVELLRIAREALSNVRKHAAASTVEVSFESERDGVEMAIKDNGSGFDTMGSFSGHGLSVMQERALSVGGELAIATAPGRGTEVKVRLPVA
jgi:signal transduction histidine kinase